MSNIVYHYTSMDAALSILRNAELYLTNIRFCNDGNEFIYGVNLLREKHIDPSKIFPGIEKNVPPYWISCFSGDEDSFAQWQLYADNGMGICLGVDLDEFVVGTEMRAVDVWYDLKKQSDALDSKMQELQTSGAIWSPFDDIVRLKPPQFESERETRIVLHGSFDSNNRRLKFEARNGRLIPRFVINFPIEAVKTVTLGPRARHPLNEEVLKCFLHRYTVNCTIGHSGIIV